MSGAVKQACEAGRRTILRSGWFLGQGRFYLDRALEEDPLGRAFAAWDERLQRRVVIRVPAERLLETAGFREVFEREVRRLASDSPDGVVAALGFGVEDSLPYAVLEDPGEDSLAARKNSSGGRLPPDRLVEALEAAAAALDRLHAGGWIHGDVRPENVRFDPQGRVRLSDIAFASTLTALGEAATQPQARQLGRKAGVDLAFGTPAYAAPERFDGRAEPASDQYSLAVTVYAVLSARLPHEGATPEALATAKREKLPRPVEEVLPELPSAAQRVLMRALSREPADRFDSCRRFAELLVRGLGPAGVAEERPRRRIFVLPVLALGLLLALVGWITLRAPV